MFKPSPGQLQLRHVVINLAHLETACGEHPRGLILLPAMKVRRSHARNQVVLLLFLSIVHGSFGVENPLFVTIPEVLLKELRLRLKGWLTVLEYRRRKFGSARFSKDFAI